MGFMLKRIPVGGRPTLFLKAVLGSSHLKKIEEKTWVLSVIANHLLDDGPLWFLEKIFDGDLENLQDIRALVLSGGGNIFTALSSDYEEHSESVIVANKKKPCHIYFGVYPQSSFHPDENRIQISLGSLSGWKKLFLKEIKEDESFLEYLVRSLGKELSSFFLADISKLRLKQSVIHELTHWLDYTLLHDYFPELKAFVRKVGDFAAYQERLVNLFYAETNAQINQIISTKEDIPGYQEMTLHDIIKLSPSLNSIYLALEAREDSSYFIAWKKHLLKRLVRENGTTRRLGERSFFDNRCIE